MSHDEETIISGGADSRIVIWKNTTITEQNKKAEEEERLVCLLLPYSVELHVCTCLILLVYSLMSQKKLLDLHDFRDYL